jgi:chromosome segregation ATPase
MVSVLRWVASRFKGEAHAIEEPMIYPIPPEFKHLSPRMREEAYIAKIRLLQDKLMRVRLSDHLKDAELIRLKREIEIFEIERHGYIFALNDLSAAQENLDNQTARITKLESINRDLSKDNERLHEYADDATRKFEDATKALQAQVREREENIRDLNSRISQSRLREDTLRHQLEENNKEAEIRLRRFNEMVSDLRNQLVRKQSEADKTNELLRTTQEKLEDLQNQLVKKESEAAETNELLRTKQEAVAELRKRLLQKRNEADYNGGLLRRTQKKLADVRNQLMQKGNEAGGGGGTSKPVGAERKRSSRNE